MKARCSNPNNPAYQNYGGRGIVVAPQWLVFENFARDVGEPPSPKDTLDRINNDGNYEPSNVRWTSRAIQSRNKRNTILLSINGRTKCLSDWCDHYGITLAAVYQRMSKGADLVSALVRPKAARFQTKPEGTGA
jgi:hypothetical protein